MEKREMYKNSVVKNLVTNLVGIEANRGNKSKLEKQAENHNRSNITTVFEQLWVVLDPGSDFLIFIFRSSPKCHGSRRVINDTTKFSLSFELVSAPFFAAEIEGK